LGLRNGESGSEMTVIGYIGMGIGILCFLAGISQRSNYLQIFGAFLVFASYLWAKKK
jgi:hypothetical protein